MVATVHRAVYTPLPIRDNPNLPTAGSAARALARCYLRYVSALWRGDDAAAAFASWIDQFWSAALPPIPQTMPDEISPHGGAGHGISWFQTADAILGYVGAASGGYRVPLSALHHAEEMAPRDTGWRNH